MKRFTLGKKNGRIKKTSQPAVEYAPLDAGLLTASGAVAIRVIIAVALGRRLAPGLMRHAVLVVAEATLPANWILLFGLLPAFGTLPADAPLATRGSPRIVFPALRAAFAIAIRVLLLVAGHHPCSSWTSKED
jgi:hypothetical protein